MFPDHGEWDAYEELKKVSNRQEWASIYADWERQLAETDRTRLIQLYIREDKLNAAFEEVMASEKLEWMKRYRDPVGAVDPETYFERYRDLLTPFAAGDTGRRHYRTIIDHLKRMRGLVADARFEGFIEELKDTHSNRPAFLGELEKTGF